MGDKGADQQGQDMTVTEQSARFWDRVAPRYAASRIADPGGYERTLEDLRRRLGPADRVLEIGCGTGTTALRLAPFVGSILATDIAPGMIAIAREKPRPEGGAVRFERADPSTAAFEAGGFDAALAMNVLHLLPDLPGALAGLHQALRPGGLLITKTPCLTEMTALLRVAVPVMRALGKAPFVAFRSAADLERAMVAAGFGIIARERHGTRRRDIRAYLVARRP